MKLKITSLFVFSVILLLMLLGFASALSRPIVTISDFNTGNSLNTNTNHFDLEIELENSGDSCAKAVTVTVQANSPFITDETPTTEPVDICNHESVTIPLKLDQSTVGGTYPLTLAVSYTDENSSNVYTFSDVINLYIKGDSDLNAHIVNSNPIDVYPGDSATISVLVENDGTFSAQSINGLLSANPPLEVKSSQSFFSVGSLGPKQSYIASFSIDIPKDAQAQVYPMDLALQYTENKDVKTKDIQLFFNVKKKAEFATSDAGSDTLYPNDFGKIIRVKITNVGTDAAKDMKIQVQPQFPFTTDGSIKYINDLEPGQSSVVEFAINVDKDATIGNYGVDLILNFKDLQGNNLNDDVIASLKIQKKSILQIIFVDYWYLWLILVIVVIIIIIRISRTKKAKKEKK